MGLDGEKQSSQRSSKELSRLAYLQLQKGDSQRAAEYFQSAAEGARGEGEISTMISCYLNAGACLVSRGKLKEGNRLLLSTLKLAKAQKLDKNVSGVLDGEDTAATRTEICADIYYNLAVAAQKMDNTKRAIACFKTSMEFYLKSQCIQQAAESLTGQARCHRRTNQSDQEIACLVRAQQLCHEAGDSFSEAEACLELARTYLRERRMDNCKEMLSTAKLLCLRIDQRGLQGKLYSQFGLIYSSMGLYDLGIQNFERALPLVRESIETQESLQAEASLLQNIGAAYNEKALYLEATVFHREAVVFHGKVRNHNAESKSLCNLAFAQTQLRQFQEAAKTFSNALAKAHLAGNTYLQFQTCEGLGSTHQHLGRFGEAASYYQQALTILDQIGEDTGIARERVMEKLSQASEALEEANAKRRGGTVQSSDERGEEVRSKEAANAGFRESVYGEAAEQDYNQSQQPAAPTAAKKISLTERRGVKTLSPIKAKEAQDLSRLPAHKHVVLPSSAKGKERLVPHIDMESDDSNYSTKLQAYVESYRDSDGSQGSWSQELQAVTHMDKEIELHSSAGTPRPSSSHSVREGSLALGPNAREKFTVHTTQEWSRGKRGKTKCRRKSEIISLSPISPSSSSTGTSGITTPTNQQPQPSTQDRNQSKICTIL